MARAKSALQRKAEARILPRFAFQRAMPHQRARPYLAKTVLYEG